MYMVKLFCLICIFVCYSYIRYSNISAQTVRECLKANLREDAAKRGEPTIIKAIKYQGGKPVGKD